MTERGSRCSTTCKNMSPAETSSFFFFTTFFYRGLRSPCCRVPLPALCRCKLPPVNTTHTTYTTRTAHATHAVSRCEQQHCTKGTNNQPIKTYYISSRRYIPIHIPLPISRTTLIPTTQRRGILRCHSASAGITRFKHVSNGCTTVGSARAIASRRMRRDLAPAYSAACAVRPAGFFPDFFFWAGGSSTLLRRLGFPPFRPKTIHSRP